jgi:hypothetical protein
VHLTPVPLTFADGSALLFIEHQIDIYFRNCRYYPEKKEMGGSCSTYGEGRVVYRFLVRKPEGKRPLGRLRRRWEDNVRMDLQEVGCGCDDWIGLAQDSYRWRTLVSAVTNLRVP